MIDRGDFPGPDDHNGRTRLWGRSTVTGSMDTRERDRSHRALKSRLAELLRQRSADHPGTSAGQVF